MALAGKFAKKVAKGLVKRGGKAIVTDEGMMVLHKSQAANAVELAKEIGHTGARKFLLDSASKSLKQLGAIPRSLVDDMKSKIGEGIQSGLSKNAVRDFVERSATFKGRLPSNWKTVFEKLYKELK